MSDSTEETETTWWARPRFLISAALVALIVVVGAVALLWPRGESETPAAAETPAPTNSSAVASSPSAGGSTCGLTATGGGSTLTKAPQAITWDARGAIQAPTSKEHGPARVDESTGVRSCFSRTPTGAVLAVSNFLASSGDRNAFVATIQAMGIDGPGRDIAIGQAREAAVSGDSAGAPISIKGFRVLSYSPSKATVEVVAGADTSNGMVYQTTGVDLVWQGGDWKVAYRPNGEAGPINGQISSLSGYVKWSPTDG